MKDVFFKIAYIFKEIKEKHNLMSLPLFEENNEEIENEILNNIIKLLIQGTAYFSFMLKMDLQIENIKFYKKLSIDDINKLTLIKNCLPIIFNFNEEDFYDLAYDFLKDKDKDKISIILGHNNIQ